MYNKIINTNENFESILVLPEDKKRKSEGGLRTQGYFKQSYEDKPLITVVTVVFNGEEHLEKTIQSVIEQSYDNVEYVIIDGESTDGTLEIIKKYEDQIDYWVSEKDGGIYDAMNKSISLSTGEWINFMNAGDSFYNCNVIGDFFIDRHLENISVFYGDIIEVYDEKHKVFQRAKPLHLFYQGTPFSHQATFIRISLLKQYSFSQQYHICSDYDFFFHLYVNNYKFVYIPKIVANFDMYGLSTDYYKTFLEVKSISMQYMPEKNTYFNDRIFFVLWTKKLVKSILPKTLIRKLRIFFLKLFN